jgi:hypothetical protein
VDPGSLRSNVARIVLLGSSFILLLGAVRYAVLVVLLIEQYVRLVAGGCG